MSANPGCFSECGDTIVGIIIKVTVNQLNLTAIKFGRFGTF